jgi:hypothetical protein
MMHLKPLLAAAAIGFGLAIAPASAATIAPQAAHADAAKSVSPLAEVKHRKKYRKRLKHRRHHHRRSRIVIFDDGWYYPPVRRRYYVDDGYYWGPVYRPRYRAARRFHCSDQAYHLDLSLGLNS